MKDIEPCRRPSGNFRAHFSTREEAEALAKDPKNVDYHGVIASILWPLRLFSSFERRLPPGPTVGNGRFEVKDRVKQPTKETNSTGGKA